LQTHHTPTIFPYTTLFRSLIGLFAFSQLLDDIKRPPKSLDLTTNTSVTYPIGKVIKDMWSSKLNTVRSSLIGTLVGILPAAGERDRKSTRLNSSHDSISYA